MKLMVFEMEITGEKNGEYIISVTNGEHVTLIGYNPETKNIRFDTNGMVDKVLKRNRLQFGKVLHTKRADTFIKGSKLKFVLRDGKDIAAFNDLSKIFAVDRRNGGYEIFVTDKGKEGLTEIFIDGSYSSKRKRGGYAVIFKSPAGGYELKTFRTDEKSSSLIELQAAIKGLELSGEISALRIVTDSRYVIKGLTEWVVNWNLNGWMTANGEKVKNIEYWKQFYKLSEGKYIEFKYVKAHSKHFENTMADLYAKDMALRDK